MFNCVLGVGKKKRTPKNCHPCFATRRKAESNRGEWGANNGMRKTKSGRKTRHGRKGKLVKEIKLGAGNKRVRTFVSSEDEQDKKGGNMLSGNGEQRALQKEMYQGFGSQKGCVSNVRINNLVGIAAPCLLHRANGKKQIDFKKQVDRGGCVRS